MKLLVISTQRNVPREDWRSPWVRAESIKEPYRAGIPRGGRSQSRTWWAGERGSKRLDKSTVASVSLSYFPQNDLLCPAK